MECFNNTRSSVCVYVSIPHTHTHTHNTQTVCCSLVLNQCWYGTVFVIIRNVSDSDCRIFVFKRKLLYKCVKHQNQINEDEAYFRSRLSKLWSWRAGVLQSLAPAPWNTPESANQALTRYTRRFRAGVLRQIGAKLCRTPALQDLVWTALF